MKIDYTLWPNADGQLGQNKVQIPDGVTTQWPEGDSLVQNFVYKDGIISGFVDTKALIANESKTTTFPYDYVNITVDGSLEGVMSFNQGERTKYLTVTYTTSPNTDGGTFDYVIIDINTTDQETLNAVRTAYRVVDKKMYDEDGNVIGTWDTSKLEVGGVFDLENEIVNGVYCGFDILTYEKREIVLTEFSSDLSSLTDGRSMFYNCSKLTTFTSDLSSLTDGYAMFADCSNLTTFTSDLSSLTDGRWMFFECPNLTTFTSDLSSLTNGEDMFDGCKLDTFTSDLSSLTNGEDMFAYCKLSPSSLKNIYDTLRPYGDTITLGLGCDANPSDINAYADEAGLIDMTQMEYEFEVVKGWTVEWQFNGRPTSTYGLRRPSEETLPVFVKLDEVEEIDTISHTSLDGSKKYNLHWFHMTSGSTEGYTQYASIEDAEEALNIKRVER